MRENILIVVNNLLSHTWLIILFGLIHLAFIERKGIYESIKQKKIKPLLPLGKKTFYPICGLLIILLSFAIVSSLLTYLMPESISIPDYSTMEAKDFWTTLKYQTQYSGLFGVIGFIIAGISLILSAGGKWLVNIAKLFITLSVLYLFFSVLIVVG